MAEIKTEQEPSIEEILESIRQIISEDGTPVAEGQQKPAAKPAAETVLKGAPTPAKQAAQTMTMPQAAKPAADVALNLSPQAAAPDIGMTDAVLELTDKIETPETAPQDKPKPRIVLEDAMEDDPLMSDMTAEKAVSMMARIMAQNIAVERELPGRPGNVTLEDMAREIMHPMIKVWIDKNLPGIIEKLVAREIEKLARRALDKE
ncbi:MAG: DUF2497 domain-containing protein [Alphaproteobacteria bacterium]